jgi:hypothetical protein
MDRIDAMKVFVSAVDEGSLAAAGRCLGRSPAAVSRAIAFLEAHVGAELLHRTTRSLKRSEAGERHAATCRRVLGPRCAPFVDFAVPRLKRYFTRLSNETSRNADAIRSPRGRVFAE